MLMLKDSNEVPSALSRWVLWGFICVAVLSSPLWFVFVMSSSERSALQLLAPLQQMNSSLEIPRSELHAELDTITRGQSDLVYLVFGRPGIGKSTAVADFVQKRQTALLLRLQPAGDDDGSGDARRRELYQFQRQAQAAIKLATSPSVRMSVYLLMWRGISKLLGREYFAESLPQHPLLVIDEVQEAFRTQTATSDLRGFALWAVGLVCDEHATNVVLVSSDGLLADRLQQTALKSARTMKLCVEPFAVEQVVDYAHRRNVTDLDQVRRFWALADGNMRSFQALLTNKLTIDRAILRYRDDLVQACRRFPDATNAWNSLPAEHVSIGKGLTNAQLHDILNSCHLAHYDACRARFVPVLHGALRRDCSTVHELEPRELLEMLYQTAGMSVVSEANEIQHGSVLKLRTLQASTGQDDV